VRRSNIGFEYFALRGYERPVIRRKPKKKSREEQGKRNWEYRAARNTGEAALDPKKNPKRRGRENEGRQLVDDTAESRAGGLERNIHLQILGEKSIYRRRRRKAIGNLILQESVKYNKSRD